MSGSRLLIQREEEPEPPHRSLAIALAIGLLAASVVVGGLWRRHEKRAREEAAAAQERARAERAKRSARAANGVARADRLLTGAVERALFPDAAQLAGALESYRESRALDADCPGAASGEQLARGVGLLLEGRPAEAEALLRDSCLGRDDALGRYFYGQFLLASGRAADAWGHFDHILRLQRDWPPALTGRALADLQTGDYGKAAKGLAQVAERYSDRADLAAAYAAALDESGRGKEAASWYRKAIALGSIDPRVLSRFGTLLMDEGHAEEVRETLTRLAEHLPGDPAVKVALGRALASLEDGAGAERELGAALEIAPRFLPAHLALAQHRLEQVDHAGAALALEAARQFAPEEPSLLFYLGHAKMGQGDLEKSRNAFAESCARGFTPACEEACYAGTAASCSAVAPERREAVMAELKQRSQSSTQLARAVGKTGGSAERYLPGRNAYSYYSPFTPYRQTGQVFIVGWNPRAGQDSSSRDQASPSWYGQGGYGPYRTYR